VPGRLTNKHHLLNSSRHNQLLVVSSSVSDTLILQYVFGLSSPGNEENFSAILAGGPRVLPFWQSHI